jgi:hypothetical protein
MTKGWVIPLAADAVDVRIHRLQGDMRSPTRVIKHQPRIGFLRERKDDAP